MAKAINRDVSKPWCVGATCDVYWNESYENEFRSRRVEPKSAAKLQAVLTRMYCEHGPENIPGGSERLNRNEGRYLVGGKRLLVWAFKDFQLRVYGVEGSVHGKRAFFASEVEPRKKKDGADQAQLKRAAERAVELAGSVKGGSL
ncbi:MAG: hypothetical protein NXI12_07955 [Alphaproteobacteria bacterium]|nr:hypothetical protein [Alphaproteobacteria bacterium]